MKSDTSKSILSASKYVVLFIIINYNNEAIRRTNVDKRMYEYIMPLSVRTENTENLMNFLQ